MMGSYELRETQEYLKRAAANVNWKRINFQWPKGSNGRFYNYRPWYRIVWGLLWVGPLYIAYGLAVCVATVAFLNVKEAVRWVGR